MSVGKSIKRVDAFDKVTGRAQYTADLCDERALIAKVLPSTIAHGRVKSMDTSEAEKVKGVVKVITCFEVPQVPFPTAGHPWTTDPEHQDIADRLLLNEHVRYYGDEIALVIAEDEISAKQALDKIMVEYEEYPHVLDPLESMKPGAPLIHEEISPNNVLASSSSRVGNYEEAIKEEGLTKVEGWYHLPTVQHAHLEPNVCYAYMEKERVVVVTSTQIPHIVRRVVGQANCLPWGDVRIVKPYIGGGFGNKQDALWEPLCAFASRSVGGRLVMIDTTREETFVNNRVRHSMHAHLTSWLRPDGSLVARKLKLYSDQGAYASHGHSVTAKAMGSVNQIYPCDNFEADSYTVYTNKQVGGAMRAYGMPQATFFTEAHTEDICQKMNLDPLEFRRKNSMPEGYVDDFSKNVNYYDTYNQLMDKAIEMTDYEEKRKLYAQPQTGPVRRGIGMSLFWYNTGVWPISIETSACRMVLNQDGSIQLQLGETEIGQGADTAFSQMAASAVGIPVEDVNIVSTQDTDVTPFGLGAYASRQTYVAGFSINQTGTLLKERILQNAHRYVRMPVELLDLVNGKIVRKSDGKELMSLCDLALNVLYCHEQGNHITAESTYQVKSNAYSFGVSVAEVEIDIPLCKVEILDICNVHDAGNLINPQTAEAQVHGGMSMSIGYGLYEQLLYDEETGCVLNDNLLDYKLSTSMDHPDMKVAFIENTEPTSPFGTRALGEPPACSPAVAIRNAILQATGVPFNTLPITPQRLYEGFAEAGLLESDFETNSRREHYDRTRDELNHKSQETA
ncbi:MAG: xanthine dehydrogenase molybdenum-binding subunit XdhA [Eubacteriales bacterium]|nr:xanthine dehydrogenase molybdenum-binding subunit XdhA [Eubacteriales bacterium]